MAVTAKSRTKEKRDERFSLRCTKTEKTEFEKNAKKREMSLTDYMVHCVNEYEKGSVYKEQTNSGNISLVMAVSNLLCSVKNWKLIEGSYDELLEILEKGIEETWNFMNIH